MIPKLFTILREEEGVKEGWGADCQSAHRLTTCPTRSSDSVGFTIGPPAAVLIRGAAERRPFPGFAVLICATQFEDESGALVVDGDIESVFTLTDVGTGRFSPPDRRNAVAESLDLSVGE